MVTAARFEKERLSADLKEFSRNADWFSENLHTLQEHLDLYVAVENQELAGVAFDPDVLYRKFAGRRAVYIAWVGPPDLPMVL